MYQNCDLKVDFLLAKCLAPHEESWGQIGYYPAMISQVVCSSSSGSLNLNEIFFEIWE